MLDHTLIVQTIRLRYVISQVEAHFGRFPVGHATWTLVAEACWRLPTLQQKGTSLRELSGSPRQAVLSIKIAYGVRVWQRFLQIIETLINNEAPPLPGR
jgi:hypothetical protein